MKNLMLTMAALLTASVMSAFAQDPTADSTSVTCGETVTLTATPADGYKFMYWDDDHSLTNASREVTIDSATTIYDYVAVFDLATYNVIAKTDQTDMGKVKGGGVYKFGSEAVLEAVPNNKCYKFVGWSDGVETAKRTVVVSSDEGDNTYVAIFAESEFKVKVTSGGNGSVSISKK